MEQNDKCDETRIINTASGIRSIIRNYFEDGDCGFCYRASRSIKDIIEYLEGIIKKENC